LVSLSRTIADKTQEGFQLVLQVDDSAPKTLLNIAEKYTYQGIIHIWFGWDHLAFVFCLCLLAANFRDLIWTVTAFTMGHSISMALSFFSIVAVIKLYILSQNAYVILRGNATRFSKCNQLKPIKLQKFKPFYVFHRTSA
jgi:hypothetical protein